MRRLLLAATIALASAPLLLPSTSAAQMSTSDLLRPQSAATQVWCKKVCKEWGYCGYSHNRYRCCKVSVCH